MIEDKFKLLLLNQELIDAFLQDEADPLVRFRMEAREKPYLCLVSGNVTVLSFPLLVGPCVPKPEPEPDYLHITPLDVVSLLGQFAMVITQCYSARLMQRLRRPR